MEEEEAVALIETQKPVVDIAANIPAMVFAQVDAHGPETILRKKDRGIWRAMSWADLGKATRQVAMALKASGFHRREVACVLADTSPAWVMSDLGILSAGGISAGLYTTESAEQLQVLLNDCRARIIFVGNEEHLDKILQIRGNCPALERIVIYDFKGLRDFNDPMCESFQAFMARGETYDAGHPGEWAMSLAQLNGEDGAALLYTSGSTGAPKGVLLSHRSLVTQVASTATLLGQTSGDERLAFLPMSHFMERILGIYQALYSGTVSNYVESADSVPENLREVMPTVLSAPPRLWEQFYSRVLTAVAEATWLQRALFNWAFRAGEKRASSGSGGLSAALGSWLVLRPVRRRLGIDRLRLGCIGGAPVSPALVRWYRALGVQLSEVYGLSEAAGVMMATRADPAAGRGIQQRAAFGELSLSPSGEVLVRDDHIFTGYWRAGGRPERSSQAGWFSTGDIGRVENGVLRITGRIEDLIATPSGASIAPSEIEAELKFSPYIADAMVVGGPGGGLSALIAIDHENVERWAQHKRIAFTGFAGLARSDAVRGLIETEIQRVNAMFAEPIKSFRVIDRKLEPEDPELTPMMKLRRQFVSEKYRDLIEGMY
jgi:long-chain acyl-CoA synthetase